MTTLDNLRKSAERWLKALRDGDLSAIERLRRAYPAAPASPTLRDVQHALARERGFADWKALKANPKRPDVFFCDLVLGRSAEETLIH